ncbi:MAG: hypothetical protein H7288_11520 [Kineosporiaceae bacterium]|nr:hypothetical protein [Aeromicrobium sp.]
MPTKTNTRRTGADLARELIAITQRIDDAAYGVGLNEFHDRIAAARYRARLTAANAEMTALTVEIHQL